MTAADGVCEVCKREREIAGIAASSIAPVSHGICIDCLTYGAEPVGLVEALADMNDGADRSHYSNVIVFSRGRYCTFANRGSPDAKG